MLEELFLRKKLNIDKLISYGFEKKSGNYVYVTEILKQQFQLSVTVTPSGAADTKVIETDSGEEYVLYKTTAEGAFVGAVRSACEEVLNDISERCYDVEIFKSAQTKRVLEYARRQYGDAPEYLWKRFPDNAVLRRRDNMKWYAVILTVAKNKLGLSGTETAEIIDFRVEPQELESITDGKKFFPGWHMNKKHWCTVVLDDSVADAEIFRRIDVSYRLAK